MVLLGFSAQPSLFGIASTPFAGVSTGCPRFVHGPAAVLSHFTGQNVAQRLADTGKKGTSCC